MGKNKSKEFLDKQVFTTYDAARICNANIASIKNWIAKGLLRAFRTPGGHYRIKRTDLQTFVVQYGMPDPFEDKARKTVLMVDSNPTWLKEVEQAVGATHFQGFTAIMDAALFVGLDRPDVIVVDLDDKGIDVAAFLKVLQSAPATRTIPVLHFGQKVAEHETPEAKKDLNVVAAVSRKAGTKALVAAIESMK
jgi:excisionase family DNA binding protein